MTSMISTKVLGEAFEPEQLFALLDIPLIIDRSADETDTKGQLEWLKLYGILFGKETEADALIAKGN